VFLCFFRSMCLEPGNVGGANRALLVSDYRSKHSFGKWLTGLLRLGLSKRFDKTVCEAHVESFSAIFEDVHARVLPSHDPHGNRESMTRFDAGADIVKSPAFRDDDYVGNGNGKHGRSASSWVAVRREHATRNLSAAFNLRKVSNEVGGLRTAFLLTAACAASFGDTLVVPNNQATASGNLALSVGASALMESQTTCLSEPPGYNRGSDSNPHSYA
jgi:hypothetical protein